MAIARPTSKLTWDDPTTYDDGSGVTESEIAGYTIHMGQTSGVYTINHFVPNAEPDEALFGSISGLTNGDWFVALSAQDLNGIDGQKTVEIPVTYVSKILSAPTNFTIVY